MLVNMKDIHIRYEEMCKRDVIYIVVRNESSTFKIGTKLKIYGNDDGSVCPKYININNQEEKMYIYTSDLEVYRKNIIGGKLI